MSSKRNESKKASIEYLEDLAVSPSTQYSTAAGPSRLHSSTTGSIPSHHIASNSSAASVSDEDDDEISNMHEEVIEDEENLAEDDGVYDLAEIADSASNHIPVSLLEDVANKTISLAYLGMYMANGINSETCNLHAISFRSTSFPSLYWLLKAAGVKKPKLTFTTKNVSKLYNAGQRGCVNWRTQDQEVKQRYSKFGLCSSKIRNTNLELATPFLQSLPLTGFLVFLLFFYAGDGSLEWNFKSSTDEFTYISIVLGARDCMVLYLLQETLSTHGFTNTSAVEFIDTDNVFRMRITKDTRFAKECLKAMRAIGRGAHPKIDLLENFFRDSGYHQPCRMNSAKVISFHSYLRQDISNHLVNVVAQDTHSLKLPELNDLLNAAGFDSISDTRLFDVKGFVDKAFKLEASDSPKTALQLLFIDYFNNCKERVTDTIPVDYVAKYQPWYYCPQCPKKYIRPWRVRAHVDVVHEGKEPKLYQCPNADCEFATPDKSSLNKHISAIHTDKVYKCVWPGCGKAYPWHSTLSKHVRRDHLKIHKVVKEYRCTYPGCGKVFGRSDALKRHEDIHNETSKRYKCPVCPKDFSRTDGVSRHVKAEHPGDFNALYPQKKR